mmetsp:Transcript_2204/g.5966  ORF Transcript_2204/g.5966 Transcript_2204/m.5966 type:complete len:230 (+) Transcript_2204:2367-3056(+)
MHIETTPKRPPRRSSSLIMDTERRAPLMPSGCPIAMAPPFTFTMSRLSLSLSMQYSACDPKASLISKRSISSTPRPAFSNTAGMATAGPIPITLGSTPATAKARNVARGFNPRRLASARVISMTMAAPSLSCDAFPAVVLPFESKTGFNLASDANVTPTRTPSSRSMTTDFRSARAAESAVPSPPVGGGSTTEVSMGTISLRCLRASAAAEALAWLTTAMRSCFSRDTP